MGGMIQLVCSVEEEAERFKEAEADRLKDAALDGGGGGAAAQQGSVRRGPVIESAQVEGLLREFAGTFHFFKYFSTSNLLQEV
jgi:hypothetical protein